MLLTDPGVFARWRDHKPSEANKVGIDMRRLGELGAHRALPTALLTTSLLKPTEWAESWLAENTAEPSGIIR